MQEAHREYLIKAILSISRVRLLVLLLLEMIELLLLTCHLLMRSISSFGDLNWISVAFLNSCWCCYKCCYRAEDSFFGASHLLTCPLSPTMQRGCARRVAWT